jgi:hypothetical protein
MPEVSPIRAAYFNWLYYRSFRVFDLDSQESFSRLCSHLHSVNFKPLVPNDDNRRADGEMLRDDFLDGRPEAGLQDLQDLYGLGDATMFEMLTALSKRANDIVEIDDGPPGWFRAFLKNLGLWQYNDADYNPRNSWRIDKILDDLNNRNYRSSGKGGIFPLKIPNRDQRII